MKMKKGRRQMLNGRLSLAGHAEAGMTLVETVIAMGIMAMVAVIFLSGLTMSSRSVVMGQERVSAESLAKSQMEYVKNLAYDKTNDPPEYMVDPALTIPAGYALNVVAERLYPGGGSGVDVGLQKVTVSVSRSGEFLFTLVDYKLDK